MRALYIALLVLGLTGCTSPREPSEEDDDPPSDDDSMAIATLDAHVPDKLRDSFITIDESVPQPPQLNLDLVTATRPPPALSGGTLAVARDGSSAVVADPDRDLIYVVQLAGGHTQTIALAMGSEPGRVVLDASGRAHVALRGSGELVSIDSATSKVLAQTKLCALPRGLAYDPMRDAVVAVCASGELVTVRATDHASIGRRFIALDLRDIVIQGEKLIVSRYRSAELLYLDRDGNLSNALTPKHLNLDGANPARFSPALAWRMVASDDGVLMLHQQATDDEVSVAPGGYGNGGCRTITLPSITQFYSDGTISTASTLRPLGLALDVAVSSDGAYVAIAEPGAITSFPRDTVELIPRSYIDRTFKGSQDPAVEVPPLLDGHGPGGAECLSYRSAGDAYQVTSVAFDGAGKLYAFSREPASLQVYSLPEQDGNSELALEHAYDFAQPSVFDTGHALFHGDVGSGLSCASCHGEALDDGHVWNFVGVGPRRTQNIRGGLMSTLPLHWGGDLPTFKSLVDEVMTRRMSGFALKLPYSDALASWIDGLPPVKLAAQDDEAAARGKALFESDEVGCASCHSGAHLTNNASYDVGTGGKFQVPTLNGLALHAPFLHDGCAATLAERFDPSCGGGDKHGHTSHLTQAEISDLLAYLQTL